MTSIIGEYLKYAHYYENEFGHKTVVLLMVGAFYEMYGLRSDDAIIGSAIQDVTSLCGLHISDKQFSHEGKQVVIAGFRDYTKERYIEQLVAHDYTCVVYDQYVDSDGKIKRKFSNTYSPGTTFKSEHSSLSNYCGVLWFHHWKQDITIGCAVIDVCTGNTHLYEYSVPYYPMPSTFDDLERFLSIYCPSELICISNSTAFDVHTLILQLYHNHCKLHIIRLKPLNDDASSDSAIRDKFIEKAMNCEKQCYINTMIETFYKTCNTHIFRELFLQHTIATQALCYLLDFIDTHNPDLISNLKEPKYETMQGFLLLANHSLQQLNIIEPNRHAQKPHNGPRCVLDILDKCKTSMGSRELQHALLHPTCDTEYLNVLYGVTSRGLKEPDAVMQMRNMLGSIVDLEKMTRRYYLHKITPKHIVQLYDSLDKTIEVVTKWNRHAFQDEPILLTQKSTVSGTRPGSTRRRLKKVPHPTQTGEDTIVHHQTVCHPSIHFPTSETIKLCVNIQQKLVSIFQIDVCRKITGVSIGSGSTMFNAVEDNIFQKGVNCELDETESTCNTYTTQLNVILESWNQMIAKHEKKEAGYEFVKIYKTDKSGMAIISTKRRAAFLKEEYPSVKISKHNSGAQVLIETDQIKEILESITKYQHRVKALMAKLYKEQLVTLEPQIQHVLSISREVSFIDTILCRIHVAHTNNYCCPQIDTSRQTQSYVDAEDLRHPLIEIIQEDEIYVTNSVTLGKPDTEQDGILLYGTNAVGKTSFIKSVGVAVIMAQSGFFVPATSFIYSPYMSLYTRILNHDNMFKGLSTFAVEMCELRTIVHYANENSLILGDELCSGTENVSAISIFVAGLKHFHLQRSSFIFATHFHEINQMESVTSLERVAMKHLAVHYSPEKQTLVYDRKMKDGPGASMYGLEVCKSLFLPASFMQEAYAIRKEYLQERSFLEYNSSKYHSQKLYGNCELCKDTQAVHIHHMQYQHHANEDGRIKHFHKNERSNLLALCESCHHKIHHDNIELTRKQSTGHESIFMIVNK